jgi:ATP-dependent DNA helicase DinG
MSNFDWKTLFPYRQVREQQSHAIESILEHFGNGGRFYALEAGTGVGKSAIGLTVARVLAHTAPIPEGYTAGAYFLTTQKMLQEQYIKDFSKHGMCSIKSAANYQCGYRKVISCAEGQNELKTLDSESNQWKACNFGCVYRAEKQAFLESQLSVTNFSYMLTDANYGGKVKPRQLLVIDEAHNVETELSKFIEITVSEKFSKDVLHLNFPDLQTHLKAYSWICESYWPKLDSHLKHMQKTLDQYQKLKENLDQFASLSKQLKLMETHHQKIKQFIELHDQNNWVFEMLTSEQMGYRKFSFKPIDVSHFAEQYLFRLGHQVLFMSATLLSADKFAESLGVQDRGFASTGIPSPFPVENRPIVFAPMGKMAASSIDSTLPSMAKAIESILDQHKNEKGIIHTHSYKVSNYLKKNVRSKRLLFTDSDNRDQILKRHLSGKTPTVLVSPSMTEGVDLEGDASRFQVICKIPFPYLGDKLVSKRMHRWDWWYPFQTAKTIIQSVGRSIRSSEDKAVTYILDSDWERFYGKNKELFPMDFRKCVQK